MPKPPLQLEDLPRRRERATAGAWIGLTIGGWAGALLAAVIVIAYDSTTAAAELAGAHRFTDKGAIFLLIIGAIVGGIVGASIEAHLRRR